MEPLKSALYAAFDTEPDPVVDFLRWLAASYDLPPRGLRLLDVGCGPGRTLVPCARLEWQVTGLEPDPDFRASAIEESAGLPGITIRDGGFADIDERGVYDMIVLVNGSFSFLLKVEERIDALCRIWQALKPGGVLFLDMANALWMLKNYEQPSEQFTTVKGRMINQVRHHQFEFHDNIWTNVDVYTFENDEGESDVLTITERFAMIGQPELRYLVEQAGFEDIRTYNSFEARASERLTGRRLMLSARKPK